MQKRTKTFLLLSIVILLLDIVFVWINYNSAKYALNQSLKNSGNTVKEAFELSLDLTSTDLQKIASFIASNKNIQDLFLQGKKAVMEEGGGPGSSKAAEIREQLLDELNYRWVNIQKSYDTRQLHFHFGPGSLSFLRVHKPGKFGDNLDDVRFTIVEANTKLIPTKGFETGRIYSGIRGVVPVFAFDPETNQRVHVGALEAGTSFSFMLSSLDSQLEVGVATLLFLDQLKENVWPEFLEKLLSKSSPIGGFFIESFSRPDIRELLKINDVHELAKNKGTELIFFDGDYWGLTSFPLRDFRGNQNSDLPDVGRVLVWKNASEQVHVFEDGNRTNLIYAVIGFIIVETLLFLVVTRYEKLNQIIRQKNLELFKLNEGLEQTVNERTEELSLAKQSAEEANLAKSKFLSRMSHELRTPLNSILGFGQLLQMNDERNLSDGQMLNIKRILSSGTHLLELVNDVLDLARIESDELTFSLEIINVNELLDEVYSQCVTLGNDKGTILKCEIENNSDTYYIKADRVRLMQVLLNLVSNGIKYNRENKTTIISLTKLSEERLRISVKDQGIGIPDAKMERLFTSFDRLDAESTNIEGVGIGLPIAKQLTEAMNGKIGVKSTEGEGSEFYVEFPICLAQEAMPVIEDRNKSNILNIPPDQQAKILYIDDNQCNINLLAMFFSTYKNIEFLKATESEIGIELAKNHAPDVILLDIRLPGIDGFEVFSILKKDEITNKIPVIALSANAMQSTINEAMDMGFHSYLTKPLNIPLLCMKINEILCV